MGDINDFTLQRAESAAARLWAFGCAQFPFAGGAFFQRHIEQEVTDTAIAFAIHVRQALDNKHVGTEFLLGQPYRDWSPLPGLSKVKKLRDAVNRIIHATYFEVGFERVPDAETKIVGGAVEVIYLRTRTDRRKEALIGVFELAACFFYHVLPALQPTSGRASQDSEMTH